MSLGMLIITIVREQHAYDNFHHDVDRIYRVNTKAIRTEGGAELYASAPLPIAKAFMDDYSFAEEVVRIDNQLAGDLEFGDVNVPITGFLTDPSFFTLFNFKLEKGNAATALSNPNSLVLTQAASKKIFGSRETLGQTLTIKGIGEFTVTGVLEEFPSKTHLDFEVLASTSLLPSIEGKGAVMKSVDSWSNYNTGYVYFKIKEGATEKTIVTALTDLAKKNYDSLKIEAKNKGYEFYLQKLTDITPGPELNSQMGRGLPSMVSNFFIILAGVVTLMACFNYTNLMIAKSLSRAREIGVRKAIGAQRWQVFYQFIGEAVFFSIFSLAVSYILLQFLKPAFLQLHLTSEFSVDLKEDFTLYVMFLLFAVIIGVLGGIIPAVYLSAIKAVKVLKDGGNAKVFAKLTFRKILMVTQFTMSSIFIVVALIIYDQAIYMISKDYKFNDRHILNLRLIGNNFDQLANEIRNLSGVERVGGVSMIPGTWETHTSDYKRGNGDKPFAMKDYWVEENFIPAIELEFVAGKNFDFTPGTQEERQIILNESALFSFDFKTAEEAIGKTIIANDSLELEVSGVVKDFHFKPMNTEIGPLAIRYNKSRLRYLAARISPEQKENVLAAIPGIWKSIDSHHPIEMKMMEDEIDDAYALSGFMDLVKIVGYISFLISTIACFGMLAMAMYSIQTRIKEIGVRKVLGASPGQIVFTLSKSFLILIGVAVLIGVPVGYFLGDLFISNYAYRIVITPWLLLSGATILSLLGIITISTQTMSAARSNPVNALRAE